MGNIVDPAADALWASNAYESNLQGTVVTRPESEYDWEKIRRQSVLLIEGANLLMIDGRVVEHPGEKREIPASIGDLTPEQSLKLINGQRGTFNALARALQDSGFATMKAIAARSYDQLDRSLSDIDAACEACHVLFWYPTSARSIK